MSKPVLRCFPFGGVGEFGKNMMVYAIDDDAVIVDCGMGFPDAGQHGVDVVVPDVSSLHELGLNIHALLITHGHEDHIGGLPHLLPRLALPVYASEVTLALIKAKLSERGYKGDLRLLPDDGSTIDVGPFKVEGVPVTHSIMDAVSIAIHTVLGIIVHTGDFKLDPAPIDGRTTAIHRFSQLGDMGVLLLASDSTNATRSGSGPSERVVGPALTQAVSQCSGKVIVTTFASNMFRIQQIVDAAVANGRRVAVAGRSLERHMEITSTLKRLNVPAGTLIDIKQTADIPANKLLVIATGSQGESRAALARLAQNRFTGLKLGHGDLVIFSSSNIPGNERVIAGLYNHIYRCGARIKHAGQAPLHVSGHAQAHELKMMMQLTRPQYFYPVHGEYRNLIEHRDLAVAAGIKSEHTIIAENGYSVIVDEDGVRQGPEFHAGAVFVDGDARDEIDGIVLRDRRVLADDGMISAFVLLSKHEGKLLGEPELVARGVLHEDVSEEVLEAAGKALRHFLEGMDKEWLADMDAAKEEVRIFLRRWCKKHIGRRPMVLPIVLAL
ncbi:ribonuclease J [Mariprofundus sp. KV]|uniref:ribonuclease J n=1 Tax=Mariprofundus sp. KV TaxID=2608715 RepID=UPI0015A3E6FB|nr:ribonuclease J [Mariprofundus sp. KV]NWF37039.1 ribonuclease J [Mariprofundus sp. KV]